MLAARYRGFKSDPFDPEPPSQKSPRSMTYEEVRKAALKGRGRPESPKPPQKKRKKNGG